MSVFQGWLSITAVTSRLNVASLRVRSDVLMKGVEWTRFKHLLDSCPTCFLLFEFIVSFLEHLLLDVFSLEELLGLDARALRDVACHPTNRYTFMLEIKESWYTHMCLLCLFMRIILFILIYF